MENQSKQNSQSLLAESLQKAQAEFPTMGKTKQVGAGKFGYSYLPLEQMLSLVTPVLLKNGLCLSQGFSCSPSGQTLIVTKLIHKSSAEIKSELPMFLPERDMENPKKNQTHLWGGAVTYQRRYSIKLILGLETDMDFNMETEGEDKITDKKQVPEVADNTVERTPTKTNQEPEENYLLPQQINSQARDLICDDIRKSGHQKEILSNFKEHFKLKVTSVRPENITLSEHGRYLRQAIEKYNDKN